MKRILVAFALLVALVANVGSAVQQFQKEGTQNGTAANIPFGFSAISVWVADDDATNDLWIRFDGGTAVASSGNGFHLKHGETRSYPFSLSRTQFAADTSLPTAINMICSGSSCAYRIEAIR